MLRWSDQIQVGLCADRLVWVRIARGFRPRVTEKRVIKVAAGEAQPGWKAALEALAGTLRTSKGYRTRATVILSNRFVRYAVVPWHNALMRRNERMAQARHCFKEIYGEVSPNWSIMVSKGAYGQAVLATAVDTGLITELQRLFKTAGVSLVSIQPYLAAAYGQFRSELSRQSGASVYFGVVEPDDVGLLQIGRDGLRRVLNQRAHEDWEVGLRGLLLQAAGDRGEDANASVCVFAPGKAQGQGIPGIKIARLGLPARFGYSPVSDVEVSMGLAGQL